jgi:hypothetical protein
MDVDDQVAAPPGGARLGRWGLLGRLARLGWLGAGVARLGLRFPRLRFPRPQGIRNGGLLLILVGLAAVMALVDRPVEPVAGGRGPGIFLHLPPPVGITQLPPATPPGGGQLSALGGDGERPAASDRAHPRRTYPRPVRSGSSELSRGDAVTAPVGGDQPGSGGGSGGGSGSGGSEPPVAAVPATQVRVAPVTVRVSPPSVMGRDLPDAEVETSEVRAETPAVEVLGLRLS